MDKQLRLAALLALLSLGCGRSTELTGDRVIRSEDDVVDIRISSFSDRGFSKEYRTIIGVEPQGESRWLLYFPKLVNLYDEAVITGSISAVEVLVNAEDILANPKNITLSIVAKPWNAFANWETRTGVFPRETWDTPGGDILDASFPPASPDIRLNDNEPDFKELAFNITEAVTTMVNQGLPNYGFMIRVAESPLNAENSVEFNTFNSVESTRPKAALVFNSKDVVQ